MANEFKVKKGLIVEGSGGTILDVQGSQGQLFSVTDSLTGDLFQVSDISGDPILNVNSSGLVTMEDLEAANATFSGDAVVNGGDLYINAPTTTYNSKISLKGYEPRLEIIKTRGSSGDDTFRIKHENDTSAVDFALSQNGGSDVRTARITANNRWVIGGHDEVNSSQLSVQGSFGVNSLTSNIGITLRHGSRPTMAFTDDTNYAYLGLESGGAIITGTTDNDFSIRSPREIVFGYGAAETARISSTGIITSKRAITFTTAISNSYVKILQVSTDSSQLASIVRLSATAHGGSHVGAWSADILVNHSQDITVKSQSGNYTLGTIKVQSNGNGEYHVLYKSTSGTLTTYYFTADSLTHTCSLSANPTSTPSTTSVHEHVLNFGTNFTQQDNGSLTNGKANFGCEVEATSLDINGAADISGNVSTSGSFIGNGSYHEFGNGTGSVSNDGSWNGRLNVAGTSHARIDAKSVSDGIVTSIYAHTGHGAGRVGTMSNHPTILMTGGNTRGTVATNGDLTMTGDVIAYSDKKLKKNIKTLDGSKVYKMRGVSFTRKDTGENSSGVIAQEIQKIAPELVSKTDGTLGVAYGNLVGYLIEAVKDQQKQIDELKKLIKNGNNL